MSEHYILGATNQFIRLTTFQGSASTRTLGGLPLGTVGNTTTGEVCVKVSVREGTFTLDPGLLATAANQVLEIAALGATTGAAVVTDANGTIQQYLRGAVKLLGTSGILVGSGTNLIGKVGIDQTTLGTTNAVAVVGGGSFVVTPKTASATGVATLVARAKRRSVSILCLDDSAETIYYGPTTGVNASTGARLKAGQSQSVDTTAAIFFFGAAGTGTIQCVETFD